MISVSVTPARLLKCQACGQYKDNNKKLKIKISELKGSEATEYEMILCETDRHDLDGKICGA